MKKIWLYLTFACLLFSIFPTSAMALSCVQMDSPQEVLKSGKLPEAYDNLFIANVIDFSGEHADVIEMEVTDALAGSVKEGETVTVYDSLANSGWGVGWNPEVEKYLIAAKINPENGYLETNSCLPNQPATKETVTELKELAKEANLTTKVDDNTPKFEAVDKPKKEKDGISQQTKMLIIGAVILFVLAIAYFLMRYIARFDDNLDEDDSKV